jgi:VWFA-related protein
MQRHFAITVALLAGGIAAAQDTVPTVIRSTAREVLVDLVVRDSHGHLITKLKPADVAVYEDGVRQDVRSFRLVAGKEVRVEDEKQAAEAAAAGDKHAPAFNPVRTVNLVCLILNDLNPETRGFAFDAARKFVNQELRPNTYIGVFSLDASGLRPAYPFSNNRESLLRAVDLAAVNQLPSLNLSAAAMFNGLSMSATSNVTPMSGSTGFADGANPNDPLGLRGDMGFSTNAGLREIDALIGLVRQLSTMPFQKTVLLLSTGLTRPADFKEYWDSLIHQAVSGGVTFYAMDVYGLGVCQDDTGLDCVAHSTMASAESMLSLASALSMAQGPATIGQGSSTGGVVSTSRGGAAAAAAGAASAQGPSPTTPTAIMAELSHQDDFIRFAVGSANRQEAIRELAERTGGFLIANTNNTDKLLAHVMEEVDTHYEIAYAPLSDRADGHFRKIEVKLARADWRVETRSGYYALPDAGAAAEEMAGLRALDTQPRPRAFDFLLRSYRFRESGGNVQYAIAFEMPLSNLTAAAADSANRRRIHASLLALVKDAQGQIVDRFSKEVSSEVAGDKLAAVQAELMTYEHAVSLPPGRYTVEAAVVDQEGGRAGTGATEIDNRAQAGIGLSDISLVRLVTDLDRAPDAADPFEFAGKRVLPSVTTDIATGRQPWFYFVVYPREGITSKPRVSLQLLKDGRNFAKSAPALPAADASGAIPLVLPIRGDPGSYELKVTVSQAGESAERTLAYQVDGETLPKAAEETVNAAGPTSGDQLADFRRKVRQDVTSMPNYTCLETIDRSRQAGTRDFIPVDKIRLEVSSVGGREMFAKPGARSFENRDVTAIVKSGMIGSGMFAGLTRTLFVENKGTFKYKGKDTVDGRPTLRYTFRLTQKESGFKIEVENRQEPVAFNGTFWFDPDTFDLVQLEGNSDDLPASLNVDQTLMRTSYARTHIGKSDALLPKKSALKVTYRSGVQESDSIDSSACREYGSDSTIRFDGPPGH